MTLTADTAANPASFKLTVRNTRGAGTSEYSFSSGSLSVGRDDTCDIVLSSDRVSRSHAVFSSCDGHLCVEDQGSANGTWVNDKRISSRRELRDDDVVRIGDCVITIRGSTPDMTVFLRLKGASSGFAGTVFEFSKSPSLVGRGEDCDVKIIHPSVSRQHCRVDRRHDGSVVVTDLESSNGIHVNRKQVPFRQVDQGDTLRIGAVDFIVEYPGDRTVSSMPAVSFRRAALARIVRDRRFLWIVVALLAAAAVTVAGWNLGRSSRVTGRHQASVPVGEVVEGGGETVVK